MSSKKSIEITCQIADFSLKPQDFSHKPHLLFAWELLSLYGIETAINEAERLLRAYTSYYGASEKYHQTLTVAGIKTMQHFISKSQAQTAHELLEEFPVLEKNFKSLIDQHYSKSLLESEEARKNYLQPDLLPYD